MSICNGVEAIQARYLRSAGSQTHDLNVMGLLTDQRARIELNWELSPRLLEGKRPSAENWRLERRPHLAAHNASPEKTLEKAIARQAQWYNQIPTASGLYHHQRDKLRNIDLVHRTTAHNSLLHSRTTFSCVPHLHSSCCPVKPR